MNEATNILIVDDIDENLVAMEALLRRPDVRIFTAQSAMQALELILIHEFSLALIDVQMPEMDGFELAELMRGAERSKYIPIIFVTAGARDAQRVFRGYETGAVDFLFKPVDNHTLRQKVDTFVRLDLQKKQIEAQYLELQENSALLSAVMDATQAMIYVKDRTGRYITANRRYSELAAQHDKVLTGRSDREICSSSHAEQRAANDEQVLSKSTAMQVEEQLEHDGEMHTYLSSKVPLRSADGDTWGMCAVSTDISHIKRMEAELGDAVQAREDVLAVVSHDMRNFLHAIKSGSAMLARTDSKLGEDVKAMIHARIGTTVDLMTRMITDLMDTANIRAGRISVTPRPEVANTIIQEALSVHEPLAQAKKIRLSADIPAASLVVACDRERIMQVLANILGNSIKFCRENDAIVVSARQEADQLHVCVNDTGPGIAAEDLPHVFDVYWSADENRQRGTGLGLFITKRIVEAHNSNIWIESIQGVGTTVHFTLPLSV